MSSSRIVSLIGGRGALLMAPVQDPVKVVGGRAAKNGQAAEGTQTPDRREGRRLSASRGRLGARQPIGRQLRREILEASY
jgi:hypothetical protein